MGFGDEADVRPVAAFGKGGESSSRGELSSDRDGFSGGRRGFGEPTRNYEGSKLNERRGNGPFGNRFSEHCDRDRPPQFGFSNFDDRRERVNNFGKNHTESGNRRKNDNDITDDWDSAAAPRFNTRQYNNRSESRRCQGNDSDRGRDFGDSRTRNFGQTDHGFNSGGRYNNERASVREKNFGFRNEGSPFGGFNGRDKSDRDRYPTRDDRGEFKENTRGFSRAAEDSRSFGRDARDFSGPGSRESAYRKADAPQGMNTTFGGFNRGGFGVRSNPRQESFYGSSGGFRSDDYDYDRGDHGGQQVFTRSRRQWSPDESKGMKRNSSPEHFGRNSSRIGVFKPREDFRQDSGYNQEKDVWGSNGERTFKRRSEFGRSSNLEGNTPRFGAQVANGSSEKERAPKEWEPEETELDTLFQRDFSNSEHLDKEHEESVIVEGVEDFTRISSWENSGLNPKLVKTCVELCNYKYLRPIQAVTIPLVLDGYDVMGRAETGGGKTAAFVLPILHKIMANDDPKPRRSGAILALIIAPTRELAKQLYDMFRKHSHETRVKCCVAYGELPRWKNLQQIHTGCDVLVGTTGRLMDYIEKGDIDVSTLRFLVLDEADMLLEDGGQHHIRSIFSNPSFPKVESRQTLLFSATFPDDVEKLARDIMKEKYVKISNGTQKRANTRVKQLFEKVRGTSGKNEKLFEILENQRDSQAKDGSVVRTLVFVGTKKQADFIALLLSQKNVKAGSINSNRPQNERERVVKELRDGSIHVLVGTDVCQRGLDIHGLDHVINYDLPSGPPKEIATKYIHRIGRTGRLHGGISTTFVDTAHVTDTTIQLIVNVAKESGQEIPVWLEEMCGIDRCGGNRSFYANGAVDSGDSTWPAHEDDLGELGTDGFNCDVARSTNRSDEQKETIEDDGDW